MEGIGPAIVRTGAPRWCPVASSEPGLKASRIALVFEFLLNHAATAERLFPFGFQLH